ncbi:hypothetical protein C0Q70_09722 [Pomacea canaliculata]|uniref:Uncharacterized protein n=1 Tax=Pomacea canaliculata TaxID=400727 RepID=A0A2T7PAM2_POMCA|nr:hypothetical protein C0Q70_09722 [Pomacea canaliculata]
MTGFSWPVLEERTWGKVSGSKVCDDRELKQDRTVTPNETCECVTSDIQSELNADIEHQGVSRLSVLTTKQASVSFDIDSLRHEILKYKSAGFQAVGKFPAYKELFSEYVWSDTGDKQSDSFSRAADVQGDSFNQPKASRLTQRAKTRETKVDKSPRDSGIVIEGVYADIDFYDENDQLPVQQELFYPRDQDIIFRGDYSHNWRQLDRTYGEDFELKPSRTPSQRSVRAEAREENRSVDPDSSDSEMDYMTFLRRKMKRDEMRSRMSTAGSQRNLSTLSYDRPVVKAISMDNIARTDVHEVYAQVHKPPRQSSRSSPGPVVAMSSPSLARMNHVYHHDVHSDSSRSSMDLRDASGSAVSRSSSHSQHRPQIYVNGRTTEEDVVIKGHGHVVTAVPQARPIANRDTTTTEEEPKEDYIVETEVLEEATTSFSSVQPQNLQPGQTEPDKENSLRAASTNPTPVLTTSTPSSTPDSVVVSEAAKPRLQ